MEERMVDPETELLLKKVTDPDGTVFGEEDFPETDEYDEDLVGLTPEQLQKAVEKRERMLREAKEESEKHAAEGTELLRKGEFSEAEERFSAALVCYGDNEEAQRGIVLARTKNLADPDALLREENAVELSQSEGQRAFAMETFGAYFASKREELLKEEKELAGEVEAAKEERGQKFAANRAFYFRRFAGSFAACILSLIALGVSAGYLYRTRDLTPVICIAVFGAIAFVMLVFGIVYTRKLLVAHRLCRANEDLRSTEKGARLAEVRGELDSLALFGVGGEEGE